MKKRLLSVVLSAAVMLSFQMSLIPGYAEETSSGECGDKVTWQLDSSGTLQIDGTGEMDASARGAQAPWYQLREKIKKVEIGENVSSVTPGAFTGCSSLEEICVDKENKEYLAEDGILFSADQTVLVCYPAGKQDTRYRIPNGVEAVADMAVSDCDHLQYISVPDSVRSIGNDAFANCSKLIKLNIPDSVTAAGYGIAYGCSSLNIATSGAGTGCVAQEMFRECYSLQKAVVPDGTVTIRKQAYQRAMGLREISIPSEVTTIEENAFSECIRLTDVYYEGTEAQWAQIAAASGNEALSTAEIHCNAQHPVNLYEVLYEDLSSSEWFFETVTFAIDNNIMLGTSDTTFEPNANLTRAALVQILYNYEGQPETAYRDDFADVAKGDWYASAVSWAVSEGIVNGVDTNSFAPGNTLTREQLAVILMRYSKLNGIDTPERGDVSGYSDANTISDWAQEAVLWAVGKGLISGAGDGTLKPVDTATRAQVATVMKKYLASIPSGIAPSGKSYEPSESEAFAFAHSQMQMIEGQSVDSGLISDDSISSVQFISSDTSVVSIDSSGVMKAVGTGSAVITAKSGKKTAMCTVSVIKSELKSIHIPDSLTLKTGTSVSTVADVNPSYADPDLSWSSSNSSVASVDQNGLISAGKPGSAVITVSAGSISSSCNVTVSFADIEENSIYINDINWAYENGIITGVSDTEFGVEKTISKAQMAVFLWRINGSPDMGDTANPFRDVQESDYFYDAVLYVNANGIAEPESSDVFGSGTACTRSMALTMMWNCQKQRVSYGGGFNDITSASSCYYPARWAIATGIANGVFDATVGPDTIETRAEIARLLHRANDTGSLKFDKSMWQIIYPEAEAVLDSVGHTLKAAFNWSAGLTYYGHNSYMPDTAAPGIEWYAHYGFANKKGNCYVMAATFYEMAVNLGYHPYQMSGKVPLRSGGLGPHSWIEMKVNGSNYVFDPDFTNETGRNGYMINYGQSGTWRYQSYSAMNL